MGDCKSEVWVIVKGEVWVIVTERAVLELLCLGSQLMWSCDVSLVSIGEVDKCILKCKMRS